MSEYGVELRWQREGAAPDFLANRYARRHVLRFDSGTELAASSSPQVVPTPWSDTSAVDPEELFVASLSSCHMLWFLSLAAKQGYCVDSYIDRATGVMEKNAAGVWHMATVTLHPDVTFSGERRPSTAELDRLHHSAHDACFIANSVKTDVRCKPILPG